MSFKITFIGAGSVGFTRRLFSDLMTVPEFRNIEVSFMDINEHNLDMVKQLCQRDLDENGIDIKIESTLNRREALKGTKYVVCCFRHGMLDAFEHDIKIPLKYGVDAPGLWRVVGNIGAAEKHTALRGLFKACYKPQGGRFAATGRSKQCNELAFTDIEVDVSECLRAIVDFC